MFKMKQFLLSVVIAAAAAACGGGGSGMNHPGMHPLVATGVITGFGSIYLNGTHFQTTHATIRKNGQTVDQSQLAVGEVARIKGMKNDADGTGDADEVDVDEGVIGPISSIDTTGGTITVLGQTVIVNAGTSFSKDIQPADASGLKVGDTIHVSGMTDSSGKLVATRIEMGNASSPLQVVGMVASLDTSMHTFKINALTVDYSSANLTGFASGAPSEGDVVEVQGTAYDSTKETLTATHVQREMTDREEEATNDSGVEREGLVTGFTAAGSPFMVDEQTVTTTSSTEYRNGTSANLANNVKVEVEGSLDSSGNLVATVITFEHNGDIELQGPAASVDATAGTLTVLGVHITVSSSTRVEDHGSSAMPMFNLSNVSAGDTVHVRGYESPAGSGMLVATRLERQPSSSTIIVKGPFTAGTSPDFTVLGIMVDASAATVSDGHGGNLTLDAFLAQAAGHEVRVEGTLSGTTVMATHISIDDRHGDED